MRTNDPIWYSQYFLFGILLLFSSPILSSQKGELIEIEYENDSENFGLKFETESGINYGIYQSFDMIEWSLIKHIRSYKVLGKESGFGERRVFVKLDSNQAFYKIFKDPPEEWLPIGHFWSLYKVTHQNNQYTQKNIDPHISYGFRLEPLSGEIHEDLIIKPNYQISVSEECRSYFGEWYGDGTLSMFGGGLARLTSVTLQGCPSGWLQIPIESIEGNDSILGLSTLRNPVTGEKYVSSGYILQNSKSFIITGDDLIMHWGNDGKSKAFFTRRPADVE